MVVKKVLKNILIFFGILIGLAFITLGCLYFIPNLTIFGIKFKKAGLIDKTKVDLKEYETQCDTITLNVGHVNLKVIPASGDYYVDFNFEVRDDARGLVSKDHSTLSYDIKLEGTNLIIDFEEPEGWIFWKDTWATLTISKSWLTSSRKTLIINASNGDASISTSVAASTIDGGFDTVFKYVEFNATGNGKLTLTDSAETLKIHTQSGSTTASGFYNDVTFISNKGELGFNAIGTLNATAKNSYIHGKQIGGSLTFNGGDGKIVISKIGSAESEAETVIVGSNVTAELDEVFGKIKTETNKGGISIKSLSSNDNYLSEITTTNAKIEIEKISAKNLKLTSTKGSIDAAACGDGSLEIANQKGKVTFTGKVDEESFAGNVKVTNNSGAINLSQISCVVDAETTGSGKISAEFVNVLGETKLKSVKGNITANVVLTGNYNINSQAVKGKVVANMKSIDVNFTDKTHQTKTICVGGGSDVNVINIYSEKANITLNQI